MVSTMEGKRFGQLLVLSYSHTKKYGGKSPQTKPYWLCKCDCGTTTVVAGQNLRKGAVISCGCAGKRNGVKHGLSRTRVYRIWSGIKSRCLNKNSIKDKSKLSCYKSVNLAKRWYKFENFLEDMGYPPTDKHEIDRLDNYKGYSPRNCRWATRHEQMMNQKRNHLLYSKYLNLNAAVPYKMFRVRVNQQGWTPEKAAKLPKQKNQFC